MRLCDLKVGDLVRYRLHSTEIYTVSEVVQSKKGAPGYAMIKNVHGHEVRVVGGQIWRYVQGGLK